jgi:DNA polymerase V
MILFARADNFFTACEGLFRPDLARKPVVIIREDNDRILAVNEEATAIGIQKGDRYAEVTDKAARHDTAIFTPNGELYADMSARLVAIYNRLCPDVEIHDTGECFLYYPDIKCPDFSGVAHHIRNTIIRETGLTVSIGIAPTRTLAKIAATSAQKTGGIFEYDQANFAGILARVPVTELRGQEWVSRSLTGRYATGTALGLLEYPEGIPEKKRSTEASAIAQELKGIPANEIPGDMPKTFSESVSFVDLPESQTEIDLALQNCVGTMVKRLGASHKKVRFLSLYLVATPQSGEGPRYSNQLTASLPYPTAFLPDILELARTLLGKLYRNGLAYRKLTVHFQRIVDEPAFLPGNIPAFRAQLDRFFRPPFYPARQGPDHSRHTPEITVKVKGRYLVSARITTPTFIPFTRTVCHTALAERKWNAISDRFRSPAYTTEFADLPSVR